MSMISSQIDELRERAKVLRQGRWSDGADDARLMEDAADTITELRGALQVASVDYRHLSEENAKLREQGVRLFDKTLELGTENAKLRELVEDMLSCIEMRAAFDRPPTDEMVETVAQQARALGLEVE